MNCEQKLIGEIDAIAQRNLGTIERLMRLWRDYYNSDVGLDTLIESGTDPKTVDPNLSCLSEMSLCLSLFLGIDRLYAELGFEIAAGYTFFTSSALDFALGGTKHVCLANSEEQVICFTPGQFDDFGKPPEYKGAKLERLVSIAPSLVRRLNDEIVILRGDKTDISSKLGLLYPTKPYRTSAITR